MHEAARIYDPVEHTNALAGLLVGAVVGLVAGAVIGALIVGTGGLAAGVFIAGAACVGTAAGGALGELVGSFSTAVSGAIQTGSPTVSFNSRPAARGDGDFVNCAGMPPLMFPDHGKKFLAEGSSTVTINGQPAARVGDRTECDAKIGGGSPNVIIGGDAKQTRPIDSEVPAAVNWTLVGLGVLGLTMMGAAPLIGEALATAGELFSTASIKLYIWGTYLAGTTSTALMRLFQGTGSATIDEAPSIANELQIEIQSGAGGNWTTIGETPGGAIAQLNPMSCGSASAEMVSGIPQAELIELVGAPTDVGALARAMGQSWKGGYIGPDNFDDLMAIDRPWLAELKELGARYGHIVVVEGQQDGQIFIRDPWDGGSTYHMALDEFARVWNGNGVFSR